MCLLKLWRRNAIHTLHTLHNAVRYAALTQSVRSLAAVRKILGTLHKPYTAPTPPAPVTGSTHNEWAGAFDGSPGPVLAEVGRLISMDDLRGAGLRPVWLCPNPLRPGEYVVAVVRQDNTKEG